jgi:hypothetical protein
MHLGKIHPLLIIRMSHHLQLYSLAIVVLDSRSPQIVPLGANLKKNATSAALLALLATTKS